MRSTVFYISGHGFGHASREVPIINLLGARREERVLIRSSVAPDMLERSVRVPFALHRVRCDTGIVQSTSVSHDDEQTVEDAVRFYDTFEKRVDAEVRALAAERINLIVADIPPLAFEVAATLDVPAVAVANFTWNWIYETHPGFLPRGADALALIREAYRKATHAVELPFSGGFDIFPHVTRVPLVSRRPTRSRADTRAHFGLPARGPVVLLSFGGYGMPALDLAQVDCRADWTIVTTDRTSPPTGTTPDHVRLIENRSLAEGPVRYEDLVAASDVVITKPGYGIIAECIVSDVPMLYTSRGHFREYDVLVSSLPRFLRSRFISHEDLFAGRWLEALEGVRTQPEPPERMPTNGADLVVQILDDVRGRRR